VCDLFIARGQGPWKCFPSPNSDNIIRSKIKHNSRMCWPLNRQEPWAYFSSPNYDDTIWTIIKHDWKKCVNILLFIINRFIMNNKMFTHFFYTKMCKHFVIHNNTTWSIIKHKYKMCQPVRRQEPWESETGAEPPGIILQKSALQAF